MRLFDRVLIRLPVRNGVEDAAFPLWQRDEAPLIVV
jgi:hypothetical protein